SCEPSMTGFVRAAVDKKYRSIDKHQLSGLVGMFCQAAKRSFDAALDDKTLTLYGNVVTERHKVAHTRLASITLGDVENGVEAADLILIELERALSLCRANAPPVAKASDGT